MKRGITFDIPKNYGQYIATILEPVNLSEYKWLIFGEESYLVVNDELEAPLYPEDEQILDGATLNDLITNNIYYLIFTDIKAFPKNKEVINIKTYNEFINSDCELIFLIVDSTNVAIYCKDPNNLEQLYKNAVENSFKNINYITDKNDNRTHMSCW